MSMAGLGTNARSLWLEYQDLNLGMAGSKPAALPLGDTPAIEFDSFSSHQEHGAEGET